MQSLGTMHRQPVIFSNQTIDDPLHFNHLMMVQERYMQENRPHNLRSAWDDDDDHPEYYSIPQEDSEYGRENIPPSTEDEVQRENFLALDNHVEEEESDDDEPQPLSVLFMILPVGDEEELDNLDVEFIRISEMSFLEASERSDQYSNLKEETILEHLRTRKYRKTADHGADEEGEICVVCQGEFEDGETIAELECGHEYHSDCIKNWLQRRNFCPMCKRTAIEQKSC